MSLRARVSRLFSGRLRATDNRTSSAADLEVASSHATTEAAPEPTTPRIAEPAPHGSAPAHAITSDAATRDGRVTKQIVLDALHDVIDPELGYNIVDIGLIYEVHFLADNVVQIVMTMTTPGCPAQDYIMNGVVERGMQIPGVDDMDVQLIWHPPWTPQMMTPIAKAHFQIPDDAA